MQDNQWKAVHDQLAMNTPTKLVPFIISSQQNLVGAL
jgi:hypothetical protein